MNRKPTPALPELLLALLLVGGVSPLLAVGPASNTVRAKPKSTAPGPAVESVAPAAPDKKPEAASTPDSTAKPAVGPDEQALEAAPRRKDRGGLITTLKARKQERQRQKAEEEALAIPENPAPTTTGKPVENDAAEPKKPGFFATVFKKRPRNQPDADTSDEAGKPETPEAGSSTSRDRKVEAEASSPEVKPKKRGFHPPWSQRKEAPESAEAPTAGIDEAPAEKPKKRGFRLPWSQKKEALESEQGETTNPDKPSSEKTKRRGFHWPWSQRKDVPVVEESPIPEAEPPPPNQAPFDPTSVLDIKPREPETGLAPSAAPTPPGKKPNPLDDIGLHPER